MPTNGTDWTCYECGEPATGIYEAIIPPAGTTRKGACDDHAPEDVAKVRSLQPGTDRSERQQ